MGDDMAEREQKQPEQDHQPSEDPDTEPPATEEAVAKNVQRAQAERH
jgi:hypothetical protein